MAPSPVKPLAKGSAVPEPLIGSFLLESITTGMYGERRNAIREYVQNSFDSLQTAVAEKVLKPGKGKITLTINRTNNSLSVYDNGIGLPHRVAVNTLTAVGASRIHLRQHTCIPVDFESRIGAFAYQAPVIGGLRSDVKRERYGHGAVGLNVPPEIQAMLWIEAPL